jgi:hypothetical protein
MTSSDPFTGTWRFNAALSTLSTPTPKRWTPEIVAGRARLTVRGVITRADGTETNPHVQAAFDGEDCPVEGSAAIETMAYARPGLNTILGTGKKGGAVCLTETVTVDATSGTMAQRYEVYRGANVVTAGVAVFERERGAMKA